MLVHDQLAALHLKAKRYEEAAFHARTQTRRDPYYLPAWQKLATVYGAQGKLAEARQAMESALRFHPGDIGMKRNLEVLRKLEAK